jgi:hypothetical protein
MSIPMLPIRLILAALATLLLATGVATRPVEIAKERFERLKPPISLTQAANV